MNIVAGYRSVLFGTVLAAAALCVMSVPAKAVGFSVSITVDENGNGTLTNTAGFFGALPFSQITDPGPGGLTGVANYGLLRPPGLTAGDLVLLEGDSTSDIIRFDPATNSGSLFFYSDVDGGVDALADIGLPDGLNTNVVRLSEVDLGGGLSGVIYTPTSGQPGFVTGAGGPVIYTLVSDVPEPGSLPLMAFGAAFLGYYLRRRKAGSAA